MVDIRVDAEPVVCRIKTGIHSGGRIFCVDIEAISFSVTMGVRH